jgi:hypothetical protein
MGNGTRTMPKKKTHLPRTCSKVTCHLVVYVRRRLYAVDVTLKLPQSSLLNPQSILLSGYFHSKINATASRSLTSGVGGSSSVGPKCSIWDKSGTDGDPRFVRGVLLPLSFQKQTFCLSACESELDTDLVFDLECGALAVNVQPTTCCSETAQDLAANTGSL